MVGKHSRIASVLLIGTILGAGYVAPVEAARTPKPHGVPVPVGAPAPNASAPEATTPSETIRSIKVVGNQRLEAETVLSYIAFHVGDPYSREAGDTALKALYATELFADVQIKDENAGDLVIQVRENPVVNRIVLEGNKRLKNDKIMPEIKLSPREIFTRSKVRADVGRIIELYRRQGRYAATVDPQMVLLDQNRVDVVFEIHEGDKSKVRRINIIGNEHFSDSQLKGQMATKESTFTHLLSSGTSYDPDRMAYDQQKMRQFYLTQGYADFRVVSAVAELTPDKKDFIITYVVEEGKRYKFGDIDVQSDIRDLKPDQLKPLIKMRKGDWYNAKTVEDTVDSMTETAGLLGYAFANIDPDFNRNGDTLTMGVTYKVNQSPRVYVERIDVNGNTLTQDKVVRREFRLSEGDAFNGYSVKRSRDRIRSLGYFQDKLEIDQKPGSAPDKVVLEANVQEKSTGQLQVSAGYSSLEKFIVSLSIEQNNFRGKGQTVRASADWSAYSKSVSAGFTEPFLFDKNLALGFDIFRRDYRSFDYTGSGNDRNTTYNQTTTGFQVRLGIPLTEYWTLATRYGLSQDKVSLDKSTYYSTDANGNLVCDPVVAGRYLCDAVGNRTTSSVGYSLVYDNLNNRITPTSGNRFVFGQDFAGLGGSVKYIRATVQDDKYFNVGSGFVLNVHGEGGYIQAYGAKRYDDAGDEIDRIRLTDRFYLGEPQLRGFSIRGVGPRVIRYSIASGGTTVDYSKNGKLQDDALGGRAYYMGHLELQIPLGSGAKEAGFKPSIFADAGSVFGVNKPSLINGDGTVLPGDPILNRPVLANGLRQCGNKQSDGTYSNTATIPNGANCPAGTPDLVTSQIYGGNGFKEVYYGGSWKPRLSIGVGVSWNSPFGPLRIDIAKALIKQKGDQTKLFSFNVGTQF
jgi:outer membrane protein insertion porin family